MTDQHAVCRVSFECGHIAHIFGEEYGDGSAWCQTCGEFQVYDRCAVCRSLDCEHPRRDPDASCDDEDDDLGCLMLSPGRGNPGQPRSSSASTCFRGGWVVDSAVRRLITAVQSLPLRDDTQEAETLAAKVRECLPDPADYGPDEEDYRIVVEAHGNLKALVALCDSHGAAYLHTYAAEAAAELEAVENLKRQMGEPWQRMYEDKLSAEVRLVGAERRLAAAEAELADYRKRADQIAEIDDWLDGEVGDRYQREPLAQDWARVAKVAEEAGEAIDALIAWTGQNPRKPQRDEARGEMLDELADTAMTAILGMQHFTKDADHTMQLVWAKLDRIYERVPRYRVTKET